MRPTIKKAIGRAFDKSMKTHSIRSQTERLLKRQTALRELASPEAWMAYLAVEETVNARHYDLLFAVAEQIAWNVQGRK